MTEHTRLTTQAQATAKTLGQPDSWKFIQRYLLGAYDLGRQDMAADLRALLNEGKAND